MLDNLVIPNFGAFLQIFSHLLSKYYKNYYKMSLKNRTFFLGYTKNYYQIEYLFKKN